MLKNLEMSGRRFPLWLKPAPLLIPFTHYKAFLRYWHFSYSWQRCIREVLAWCRQVLALPASFHQGEDTADSFLAESECLELLHRLLKVVAKLAALVSSHPQDRPALPCLDLVLPTTLPVGWYNRDFLCSAAWPLAAPHLPSHPIGSKHPIGSDHNSCLSEHVQCLSPHLPVPDQLETPLTFCCNLSLCLQ